MPIFAENIKVKEVSFGLQKIKEIYCWPDLVWKGIKELAYYGVATPLSSARYNLAATSIGDYALFGGGNDSSYSSVVDAYNSSLVRSTPTPLSSARGYLAATSIGDYALFGGGYSSSSSVVDVYQLI